MQSGQARLNQVVKKGGKSTLAMAFFKYNSNLKYLYIEIKFPLVLHHIEYETNIEVHT